MQYFLGLPTFKKEKVFAPSLFVEIRKRLGTSYWQDINTVIIEQDITYPTDLKILNASRQKLEEIIATVCVTTNQEMPRTYKRVARRDFLNVSKKKNAAISKYAKAMESS